MPTPHQTDDALDCRGAQVVLRVEAEREMSGHERPRDSNQTWTLPDNVPVTSSGPAYAEWVKVSGGDEAEKTVYVDPATIRRNSNLVKMWQLQDYKTVQTVGGIRFLTAKEEWEFDCAEERSRVLASRNSRAIWEVEQWFIPTRK